MKNFFINDLLPEGFKVLLPEEAHKEEIISRSILDLFFQNGYLLVKTPMMEYEDNISQNTLKSLHNENYLLIEPETKKILVLRSDITPQIAKLAGTKLKHFPRPIRFAYSGEVIRNSKNNYKTEKQLKQIGVELIGGPQENSMIEILNIAITALKNISIKNITIDFSLPSIFRIIDNNFNLKSKSNRNIKKALENKDPGIITDKKYNYINGLILMAGTIEEALRVYKKFVFPKKIDELLKNFFKLIAFIKKNNKNLSITVDMTEGNSFLEYFNFGFKIYNKENARHIAVGGDYKSNNNEMGMGMTFLVSQLLESTNFKNRERVYSPFNVEYKKIKLKKSFIIIKELFAKKNILKEAKKQSCDYILNKNGRLKKVN
jgi:ATP phosphoribosyltransferase regulatory subunit